MSTIKSPYKFLDSYSIQDKELFFGRERESKELYKKFFSSNLLVLYGKSGTGKSSLINCGLMANIPSEDVMTFEIRCSNDPFNNLIDALRKKATITSVDEIKLIDNIFENNFKPLAFIFDQFEEIFIIAEKSKRDRFIKALVNILNYKYVKTNIIISIREEYLANLTDLETDIPNLFNNRFRLRSIEKGNLKHIIEKPCQKVGVKLQAGLTDKIIERITNDLEEIELTYFQVMMDNLFKKAVAKNPKSPELSIADFDAMGNIENIMGDFLNYELLQFKEMDKVEAILKAMVTNEGTKKLVTIEDLASATLLPNNIIKKILYELIKKRIVSDKNEKNQYELKHDILAKRIFGKLSEEEKKAREVMALIQNRYNDFKRSKTYIDKETLEYIQPYLKNLKLDKHLIYFIKKSQDKTFDKLNARQFRIITLIIIPFIIVSYILWYFMNDYKSEIRELSYEKELLQAKTRDVMLSNMRNDFVFVKGGGFYYGLNANPYQPDSSHYIYINDMYINNHEVTVDEYRLFCNETGYKMPVKPPWGWSPNMPVTNVNWEDANAYCAWLSKALGQNIRLPEETEFEYIAKGGVNNSGYRYSGSNYPQEVAVFKNIKPAVICSKKPNEIGVYDMSGNVREWCNNWYDDAPGSSPSKKKIYKAVRGGAFSSSKEMITTEARYKGRYDAVPDESGKGLEHFGFRVAKIIN